MSDALLGHALDGRYVIEARLARGGMATVYRATDVRLGRTVAVKVMHEGLGDDTDFARKFDREARAAARLSHPNVVSVFDQGLDRGRPYIVMEYVEGSTLRSVIVRDAPMTPLRVLDLLDPVLSALAAAHEAGLVHRDVKPENVLISTRGGLKVADFGLAKALSAQTATATQGLLIGTVSYVPPELVMEGNADTRSDVYSTGIVLFEMLTGRKPHTGDTPIQVAYAHVHNDVPAPSTLLSTSWRNTRDAVPPYLDALVLAAVHRDPERRPRDARVLQEHLRAARAALLDGVMDDPALDAQFRRTTLAGDEATQVVLPSGGLVAPAAHDPADEDTAARPHRWHRVTAEASSTPRTPISPQDFEHTLPPSIRLADEQTPVDAPAAAVRDKVAALAARADRARQRRRRGRLVALLMAVLITVLGGWWLTEGRYEPTPDVVGQSLGQAQALAQAADLSVETEDAYSETVAKGTIISTVPEAEVKIRRGSSLRAVVSLGPERYAVPTLVGLDRAAAEEALGAAHLKLGAVNRSWSESVPSGEVVSASRQAGASVKRDTTVELTISKGKQPIAIADQRGKDADAAERALQKLGFGVERGSAHSKTVASGDVISQSPRSGTGHRGDTVTLTVSKGPVMVAVPNVHKMGVEAAKAAITKAGFTVVVKPVEENYLGLGYVAKATPSWGSKAAEGSSVTIYVV